MTPQERRQKEVDLEWLEAADAALSRAADALAKNDKHEAGIDIITAKIKLWTLMDVLRLNLKHAKPEEEKAHA